MQGGAALGAYREYHRVAEMDGAWRVPDRSIAQRHRLLLEQLASREGHHLFLYPFACRHVHLGLASLLGWRLSRQRPNTFSISINDDGVELLAAKPLDLASLLDQRVLAAGPGPGLLADMLASLNSSELARRRLREIARVAGLVFTGYPVRPSAASSCRPPAACSTTSSASTTRPTACWARPMPRCWRRGWICSNWPPVWRACGQSACWRRRCRRPARLRWP